LWSIAIHHLYYTQHGANFYQWGITNIYYIISKRMMEFFKRIPVLGGEYVI